MSSAPCSSPTGSSWNRWGFGRVVDDRADSGRLLKRARRAAAACPNGAFTICDDTTVPASSGVATT